MKTLIRRFLVPGLLGCTIFLQGASDNRKQAVSAQSKLPPQITMVNLPDVAVTKLAVTLESTDLGTPGIATSTDRVKVSGTVQNIGPALVPAIGSIKLVLTRDAHIIQDTIVPSSVLRDKGFSWSYSFICSSPHNPHLFYSYKLAATPTFNECGGDNNYKLVNAHEEDLHGTNPPPDLAITDFRVTKENNYFNFVVRVENMSLTYIPGSASVYYNSRIEIRRGNTIIAFKERIELYSWPTPKTSVDFPISVKSDSFPGGPSVVRAAISGFVDHESNPANNVSSEIMINN
jgi:hypothetical protein